MAEASQVPECAVKIIAEFEGYAEELPDGRARAYPDPITHWALPTIGFGTTRYPDGSAVKQGDIITRQQAEEYLAHELENKCRAQLEKIPTWKDMNDNQKGALYSFAYNLGAGFHGNSKFQSITRVCDTLSRWGDEQWVTEQFVKYRNPGTAAENGLRRRREAEAKLFCTAA